MGATLYEIGPTETLAAILPMNRPESGTHAFRGLTASGKTYWIKVPFQSQGPRVLATEQIVSAVGRLFDAPVRDTALIQISEDWNSVPTGSGLTLKSCIAHGSLELDSTEESREQIYMRFDDNSRRWPRWAALWDLCIGSDEQWLYAHETAKSMWSFDHNLWIHDTQEWDAESCQSGHDLVWTWTGAWDHFDATELVSTADRLDSITREELVDVCYAIPAQWDVPKHDLDALVDMLHYRRTTVAARLRVKSSRTTAS